MPRYRNISVQQFKQLMDSIPRAVTHELIGTVQQAGETLAGAMRPAVPRGIDGRNELVESVQVRDGKTPLQVKVTAGGKLTTRQLRSGSGKSYDYALANEFGTQNMAAQPFFWPTYRLLKKRLRAQIARGAKRAIGKVVKLT